MPLGADGAPSDLGMELPLDDGGGSAGVFLTEPEKRPLVEVLFVGYGEACRSISLDDARFLAAPAPLKIPFILGNEQHKLIDVATKIFATDKLFHAIVTGLFFEKMTSARGHGDRFGLTGTGTLFYYSIGRRFTDGTTGPD